MKIELVMFMLTNNGLAGVTPDMNLTNLLCTGDEACERGDPLCTDFKLGYREPDNFFKKKEKRSFFMFYIFMYMVSSKQATVTLHSKFKQASVSI